MPVSAIRAHLDICTTLTTELQSKFPSGLVIPFGAAISGHGTLTSDCDMCFMTRPLKQTRALFTPPNYQPHDLIREPTYSLTPSPSTPPPPPPPPCLHLPRPHPLTQAASPLTSANTTNPPSNPPTAFGIRFNKVASAIHCIAVCSKVNPVRYARCPIVQFNYEYGSGNFIRCDLCIDNL